MIRGIGGQGNSKIDINFFSKLYMPIDLMKRMISFEHLIRNAVFIPL